MWLDEFEISKWAYHECLDGTNSSEFVIDLITHGYWAFQYCVNVFNDKKIRKRVKLKHLRECWAGDIEDLFNLRSCLPFRITLYVLLRICFEWIVLIGILLILFPFFLLSSIYEKCEDFYFRIKWRIKRYVARSK